MHPYKTFPDRQFWNRAVSQTPWAEMFVGQPGKFRLARGQSIASAGSCFARRIAEHLIAVGYDYTLFEDGHPLMEGKAADYGYGVFSCRYGNIYTTRQLRQLFEEALGLREPIFNFVKTGPDRYVDLMRPNIGQDGFGSAEEARADRLYHLGRVREMIEQMEVFVFTLGLTEAWADEAKNIVYGTHPSVIRPDMRLDHITPVNLDYNAVLTDLNHVLDLLARHNRRAPPRTILTVSPVGLAATHQDSHVLTATTYSKSVLRAVAGAAAATRPEVDYFPSYEIFSLSQSFGQFLADDLREVSARGIAVAMRTFEAMFLDEPAAASAARPVAASPKTAPQTEAGNGAQAECDEIANAVFGPR